MMQFQRCVEWPWRQAIANTGRKTADKDRSNRRFFETVDIDWRAIGREREEKTLRWVDPSTCRMWARHNRDYSLLNEENCRELIDGIRAQGRQEFPAIVRKLPEGSEQEYEVIAGARRHFAITWLRLAELCAIQISDRYS